MLHDYVYFKTFADSDYYKRDMRIKAIRERWSQATSGPYSWSDIRIDSEGDRGKNMNMDKVKNNRDKFFSVGLGQYNAFSFRTDGVKVLELNLEGYLPSNEDAIFLAHSWDDIKFLLSELESMNKHNVLSPRQMAKLFSLPSYYVGRKRLRKLIKRVKFGGEIIIIRQGGEPACMLAPIQRRF